MCLALSAGAHPNQDDARDDCRGTVHPRNLDALTLLDGCLHPADTNYVAATLNGDLSHNQRQDTHGDENNAYDANDYLRWAESGAKRRSREPVPCRRSLRVTR